MVKPVMVDVSCITVRIHPVLIATIEGQRVIVHNRVIRRDTWYDGLAAAAKPGHIVKRYRARRNDYVSFYGQSV